MGCCQILSVLNRSVPAEAFITKRSKSLALLAGTSKATLFRPFNEALGAYLIW